MRYTLYYTVLKAASILVRQNERTHGGQEQLTE